MLTQLLPNKPFYAIRVPVEAKDFDVIKGIVYYLTYHYKGDAYKSYASDEPFELIGCCTTTEVDFDCSGIVDSWNVTENVISYFNYMGGLEFHKSTASLRSLLTSKGIEPTDNEKVLIIKKIK